MEVGTEVVRVSGGLGYTGAKGKVVEVGEGRVRVYWHTPASGTKAKRTWVKPEVVVVAKEGGQ